MYIYTSSSPVPASPFVRIMAAPSFILRRASPRFLAPQTNGTLKTVLSTWFSSSAGVRTDGKQREGGRERGERGREREVEEERLRDGGEGVEGGRFDEIKDRRG